MPPSWKALTAASNSPALRSSWQVSKTHGHQIPIKNSWTVQWTRHHLVGFIAQPIVLQPRHILYRATKHRYDNRPTDCLWWSVSANPLGGKKVIRSWTARRVRQAIIEALKARGFDRDGRPVRDSGATHTGSIPLTGTVRVMCCKPGTEMHISKVKAGAQFVVDTIIKDVMSPTEYGRDRLRGG